MGQERPHKMDLEPEVLSAYAAIFINRRDMYPLQVEGGTYVSIHKPLTERLVAAHVKGNITIGAYALDPNGWSKWVCFDSDDEKRWGELTGLARVLADRDITTYLEPSRRGGHLWLFFSPIPGFQARRFAKQLLTENKIEELEIYPKQNKPETGPGSFVRLPLGIHRISGRRYHFITLEGQPLAPTVRDQVRLLTTPRLVPQVFIDQLLEKAPAAKFTSPTPAFKKADQVQEGTPSERIKAQISVADFVSQYVELDSRGKAHCPFHDDVHKSFQVNRNGNYWSCYAGCGGGSVIDFWMKMREKNGEDASFAETIKDLAKILL